MDRKQTGMEMVLIPSILLLLVSALWNPSESQPYIGANYGEVADNLPPAEATARLLESTTISKIRLYGVDSRVIRSLAGTNISVVIGATNGEIPSLAGDPAAAVAWISANVLPFHPASWIAAISVGNEVLTGGDPSLSSQLLPAMRNLRAAAPAGIKISTVHSMAVLSGSEPPSSGSFRPDLVPLLGPILAFLRDGESPFMINPYPYFAFQTDPRPETLAFCLFRPNPGRLDPAAGITYTNMFDAQVAAVRSALSAAGFAGQEIVVAETGWPYNGDPGEAGATLENAQAYNANLVAHLRTLQHPIDTFLFALYDEDLKPGPASERSFGLFTTNLTPIYDAGINKPPSPPLAPPPPPPLAASPPPITTAAPPPARTFVAQNLPRNSDVTSAAAAPGLRLGVRRVSLAASWPLFLFLFCK